MPKAKKKKINPRRKPATFADVEKGVKLGTDIGVKQAIKMCLYILLDKHNAPKEDVKKLAGEIEWLAGHINARKISWNDVDKVLKENEVEVHIR